MFTFLEFAARELMKSLCRRCGIPTLAYEYSLLVDNNNDSNTCFFRHFK
jgi:hypothetical protein